MSWTDHVIVSVGLTILSGVALAALIVFSRSEDTRWVRWVMRAVAVAVVVTWAVALWDLWWKR